MRAFLVTSFFALLGTAAANPQVQVIETEEKATLEKSEFNAKAAPWWDALRDEAFYRQCQSSCTEFSQGIKTTVELCDDTQVSV